MKNLLTFLILLTSSFARGQDVVFIKYNASPLNHNPAMTGAFDGAVRISSNHSRQWTNILNGNGYKSYSLSIDKKIKAGGENYIGVGLLGVTDVAGELNLRATGGKLSFSYMHSIGQSKEEAHYVIIGQNIGVVNRSINLTNARWPTQVANGVFDPTIPPPEPDFEFKFNHFDMTTGIMWISQFKGHSSLFGGLVVHHVNKPNVSFLNREELLSRRLSIHGGGEFGLNNNLSILPSIAYNKQGVHQSLNMGSGLRSYFGSGQNYADFGINYLLVSRIESGLGSSAIAFHVRSNLKGLSMGLCYVQTMNGIRGAKSFELSLGYIFGKDAEVAARMPRY